MRPFASALCAALWALLSCVTGAIAAPVLSSDADAREIRMGREVAKTIEEKIPRIADPAVEARLTLLLDRLTPFLKRRLDYRVVVLDEKTPNAFTIPGGTVYVTRGLLDFVRGDAELSAVLAHELTHADKRHVMIQVARNEKLNLLALAVVIASQGQAAAAVMANAVAVAVGNAYEQDLEREADRGGVELLRASGVDPVASLTILERLAYEEIRRPHVELGIYQDHPDLEERIDYTRQALREGHVPLHRKRVLGVLRPSLNPESGDLVLRLDRVVLCALPETPESRSYLEGLASRIDRWVQLETPPYDLRVSEDSGGDSLLVGTERLIEVGKSPRGVAVEQVRAALVAALESARRGHPLADWFR